ncbi:MAG: hypothetical protein ACWA42_04560 [Lutibacter sp.]
MKTKFIFFWSLLLISLVGYSQVQDKSIEKTYVLTQLNQQPNQLLTNSPIVKKANYSSIIKLNQTGNFNTIDLKANAQDSQLVNQLGNQNNYTFINYFNNNPSSLNVLQQGNGNFLQVYGQNSIMDKMSIIQKGNAKTLIIKNY